MKSKLGYDDSLDAFGVHGVDGTLGALLTGVFATRAVQDLNREDLIGLVEGGDLKVLDATISLRVDTQAEIHGLDLSEHGEEGYIFI